MPGFEMSEEYGFEPNNMSRIDTTTDRMIQTIGNVLIGKEDQVRNVLIGLLARGHVLIEDIPGVGKTLLALATARSMGVRFRRIQFTSDTLPADVIGVLVDAAAEPLEQAELVLELLTGRGMVLRSVARTELPPDDRSRRSGLIVANKTDVAPPENVAALRELYADRLEVWPISAATGEGLDALRERLWQLLAVVRVYPKKPGLPPDHDQPFTLLVGSTIEDLARAIHRELPETMKFARIWGEGRISGRHVQRAEVLRDKDVVEIRE